MSPKSPENRANGINILSFAGAIRDMRGEAVWAQVLAALPEEIREPLQHGGITTGSWYPLPWYRTIYAVTRQVLGAGPELAREVGRVTTRHDLSAGIFRVFTRFLSPSYVVSCAAKVFNKYYESGTMEVTDSSEHSAHAVWEGCIGFDDNIWEEVIGGCAGALEAAGAKNVEITLVSGGKAGDLGAVVEARWS